MGCFGKSLLIIDHEVSSDRVQCCRYAIHPMIKVTNDIITRSMNIITNNFYILPSSRFESTLIYISVKIKIIVVKAIIGMAMHEVLNIP